MEFFWIVFWAVFCYIYAKDTAERCPKADINPINYILGGALFGIFAWLWCWNKKRNYNEF